MSSNPEPPINDSLLVEVKAQVMMPKDEIGGWTPVGAGGLSEVALYRRPMGPSGEEYLIQAQRLTDKSETLNCVLRPDLLYKNPNPTFHYWKSDERRFGLTFQTSGDANAFHRGVKRAMTDMKCGVSGSEKKNNVTGNGDVNDDGDVFMKLNLPLGRKDSTTNSVSTNSTTTSSPGLHSPPQSLHGPQALIQDPHLQKIDYSKQAAPCKSPSSVKSNKSLSSADSRDYGGGAVWVRNSADKPRRSIYSDEERSPQSYYVQFAKPPAKSNEYHYPEPVKDPRGSFKLAQTYPPPPTKLKRTERAGDTNRNTMRQSKHLITERSRCCYCNKMYTLGENAKGSCADAPDPFKTCIERVSCIFCARGMLYHCLSDADGNVPPPCICDSQDANNGKKWTALTVLSLFVPCLWCYWPLMACHRCGVSCGCCGGRHRPVNAAASPDLNNC